MRILIAEDEPIIALALAERLRILGHQPLGPAGDGLEALDAARAWGASIASSGEGVSSALRRSDSGRWRGRQRRRGPATTSRLQGAVIRPTFYSCALAPCGWTLCESGLVSWIRAFGHAVSRPEGRLSRSDSRRVRRGVGRERGFGASCWPERAGCLFEQPRCDQPRGGGVLLWTPKGVVGAPIPRMAEAARGQRARRREARDRDLVHARPAARGGGPSTSARRARVPALRVAQPSVRVGGGPPHPRSGRAPARGFS